MLMVPVLHLSRPKADAPGVDLIPDLILGLLLQKVCSTRPTNGPMGNRHPVVTTRSDNRTGRPKRSDRYLKFFEALRRHIKEDSLQRLGRAESRVGQARELARRGEQKAGHGRDAFFPHRCGAFVTWRGIQNERIQIK